MNNLPFFVRSTKSLLQSTGFLSFFFVYQTMPFGLKIHKILSVIFPCSLWFFVIDSIKENKQTMYCCSAVSMEFYASSELESAIFFCFLDGLMHGMR